MIGKPFRHLVGHGRKPWRNNRKLAEKKEGIRVHEPLYGYIMVNRGFMNPSLQVAPVRKWDSLTFLGQVWADLQ